MSVTPSRPKVMNPAKVLNAVLNAFIVIPIWFYLLFKILEGINASELTWFLFWVYVPIGTLTRILSGFVKD